MATFEPPPGQQSFAREHWQALSVQLAMFDLAALRALYRASYSATFAADLREMVRGLVKPGVADEWEA